MKFFLTALSLLALSGISLQTPIDATSLPHTLDARADGWCNTVKRVVGLQGYRIDEYPAFKSGGTTKVQTCILKKGAKGAAVESLQQSLNVCHGGGLKKDGDFGDKTFAALKKAQKEVEVDVDGVWGPKTGAAMNWDANKVNAAGEVYSLACKRPSF